MSGDPCRESLKGQDVFSITKILRVFDKRLAVGIEKNNDRLWDECPNIDWYLSMKNAQSKLDNWRR